MLGINYLFKLFVKVGETNEINVKFLDNDNNKGDI